MIVLRIGTMSTYLTKETKKSARNVKAKPKKKKKNIRKTFADFSILNVLIFIV